MELNKNSITSKLYRWFYDKGYYEMPSNLCPYFWQLIFMWIVFIPSVILSLPYSIMTKITEKKSSHHPVIGFILWAILYLIQSVFIALGAFFFKYEKDSYLYHSAILGWFVIIVLTGFGIVKGIEYLQNRKQPKSKQSNIVIEFVKAKYNKYCPQINWKN